MTTDGGYGFLQIIQQATVTNAPGYYLRFIATSGNSLPTELFANGAGDADPAGDLSMPGQRQQPAGLAARHRALLQRGRARPDTAAPGLLYYAETTDPALATRQVKPRRR